MQRMLFLIIIALPSVSVAEVSQSTTLHAYKIIGESLTLGDCDLTSEFVQEDDYDALLVSFYWSDSEYEYSLEREYTNNSPKRIMSNVAVKKYWWIGEPYAVVLEYIEPSMPIADKYRLTFDLVGSKVVSVDFKIFRGAEWNIIEHIFCSNES